MKTVHWNWSHKDPVTGQDVGKKNVINNYCISLAANEPRCTSCHIGYGYTDASYDFTVQENVDCLACHADTVYFRKFPSGACMPILGADAKEFPAGSGTLWLPVDLVKAAGSVRLPGRDNCGVCHFYGGGADAVKHGDLDSSLMDPSRSLDVHMDAAGLDFTCVDCHNGDDHQVRGEIYTGEARVACSDCHSGESAPHAFNPVLARHARTIACETCHIPEFARAQPTKMTWDWSQAGQLDAKGKPIVKKDAEGHVVYDGQKGAFTSAMNVVPEYRWWNGTTKFMTVKDRIDPSKVVTLTDFQGKRGDGLIMPFKVFTGKQPYDSVNNTLVTPNLFPNNANDAGAYWKSYDWQKAITSGMATVGAPYSGQFGFVSTEFLWAQNHMVAPKERALSCDQCHAVGGRLDFAALGYSAKEAKELQKARK
jgi:octaheme c-type cytochrome (tetrathionate reductase family)